MRLFISEWIKIRDNGKSVEKYCEMNSSYTQPKGIEPLFQEPESCVISITLRLATS